MNWLELAVLLWLGVIGPVLDIPLMQTLTKSLNPMRRIYAYWFTIMGLVILTLLVWPSRGASLLASPFGTPSLGLQIAGWILIALMSVNTIQTWIHVNQSIENRIAVHKAFATLDFILPTNRAERLWFAPAALSAGIFEEILFRSFLIRFFEFMPLWGAALASAAIFGIAHIYQGWKGVLGTFVFAIIYTVIVAGTGSLFIAMVVHAIWDLRVLLFMLPNNHQLLSLNNQSSDPHTPEMF